MALGEPGLDLGSPHPRHEWSHVDLGGHRLGTLCGRSLQGAHFLAEAMGNKTSDA